MPYSCRVQEHIDWNLNCLSLDEIEEVEQEVQEVHSIRSKALPELTEYAVQGRVLSSKEVHWMRASTPEEDYGVKPIDVIFSLVGFSLGGYMVSKVLESIFAI